MCGPPAINSIVCVCVWSFLPHGTYIQPGAAAAFHVGHVFSRRQIPPHWWPYINQAEAVPYVRQILPRSSIFWGPIADTRFTNNSAEWSLRSLQVTDNLFAFSCRKTSSREWKFRLRNDLYCVGWGVKLYSLTHSLRVKLTTKIETKITRTRCRCNTIGKMSNVIQIKLNQIRIFTVAKIYMCINFYSSIHW